MTHAMNQGRFISVVMSVRNGERFLRRAVSSILEQHCGNFEFIIVDDGSTDSTEAILQSIDDPRLILLRSNESRGLASALNLGVRAAKGELIARMDADDISLPNRLGTQAKFLADHPDVVMVSAQVNLVDAEERITYKGRYPVCAYHLDFLFLLINPFWHPAAMFRRSTFEAVGGYNEAFPFAQDYDLWSRMRTLGKLAIIDEVLVHYRTHEESITQSKLSEQDSCAVEVISRNLLPVVGQIFTKFDMIGMREILLRLPLHHANEASVEALVTVFKNYISKKEQTHDESNSMSTLTQRLISDLLALADRTSRPSLDEFARRTASTLASSVKE